MWGGGVGEGGGRGERRREIRERGRENVRALQGERKAVCVSM